ncbi:MAG: hypothetical protein ACFFAY_04890 [Promethearchaeota archaeon]
MNVNTAFGVAVVGLLALMVVIGLLPTFAPPMEPLPPIPPSDTPPDSIDSIETLQVGSLLLNTTANATGMIPHYGLMIFRLSLIINITNIGSEAISDFRAIRVSVYSTENELFYTFRFQNDWNATIEAGESVALSYQNYPTSVEKPFEPWDIYARVLVTFDVNREVILTTPLIFAIYAIE